MTYQDILDMGNHAAAVKRGRDRAAEILRQADSRPQPRAEYQGAPVWVFGIFVALVVALMVVLK